MKPRISDDTDLPFPAEEKLDSWKEIAAYLGKGVTTVRRWEREEGLPVRRQEHVKRGSVVAYRSELDGWQRTRTTLAVGSKSQWRKIALAAACAAAVGMVASGFFWRASAAWNPQTEIQILTASPGGQTHVTFAPGARRFAFASAGNVYVKDPAVDPPRQIYSAAGQAVCCLRWSPDGNQIAISYQAANSEWKIALIDPTGRLLRTLGRGGPELNWKRDGKAILYSHRPQNANTSAIFEYDLTTSRSRQVSFPPEGSWGDIAAAPDGEGHRLVLARYPRFGQGDVYVADYGGSHAVRLTQLQNWVVGVEWLPHDRGIIFGGMVHGQEGLFRLAEDGAGGPFLIPGSEGTSQYPEAVALSDGAIRIGFDNDRWNSDLTIAGLSTGVATTVAVSTQPEEQPDLSADGHLIFSSARSGLNNLWTCAPGCTEVRQITSLRERQPDLTSRWSPDGRRIAYVSMIGGLTQLVVMGSFGEAPRVVSSNTGESAPSWSADGKFIYFQSDRSGRAEIWRIPASGGGLATQITRNGGLEAFESPDGRELFFIRTNENATLFRLSFANGVESPMAGLGFVHRRNWRPVGRTILYWPEHVPHTPSVLYQFDLDSRRLRAMLTAKGSKPVMSFSANAQGQVVWSDQGDKDTDLKAVDLSFPGVWERF